jgi:hypothetical protein
VPAPGLLYLAFGTLTKRATPGPGNPAPILVIAILAAAGYRSQLSVHLLPYPKALTTLCSKYWRVAGRSGGFP